MNFRFLSRSIAISDTPGRSVSSPRYLSPLASAADNNDYFIYVSKRPTTGLACRSDGERGDAHRRDEITQNVCHRSIVGVDRRFVASVYIFIHLETFPESSCKTSYVRFNPSNETLSPGIDKLQNLPIGISCSCA